MTITQDMINVTLQKNRQIYIKLNLLQFDTSYYVQDGILYSRNNTLSYSNNIITIDDSVNVTDNGILELSKGLYVFDTILGYAISGNVTIDSTSDLRRSLSLQMAVTDSKFDLSVDGAIWLNRYIQLYIGIKNNTDDNIIWFNQGIFVVNNPSWQYDITNSTLTIEGLDLVSLLNGDRNGYMEGITTLIPSGSNIKTVMTTLLQQFTFFTDYDIEEAIISHNPDVIQPVPNDLTFEQGSTIWDIICALRDIVPNYECYFDENGVFCYKPISTGEDEDIYIKQDIFNQLVISENTSTDFSTVKNRIEVYGRTHENIAYVVGTITTEASPYTTGFTQINMTISTLSGDLPLNSIVSFTLPNAITTSGIDISINEGEPHAGNWGQLLTPDAQNITSLEANTTYLFYRDANYRWTFLGGLQAYGVAENNDINHPLSIPNIGTIRIPLYGGEYDNITSDYLAQQRAEWELYRRNRLTNNITLTNVPIYYVDVNKLVTYYSNVFHSTNQWLVTNISTDLSVEGTQTINMTQYYPYTQSN